METTKEIKYFKELTPQEQQGVQNIRSQLESFIKANSTNSSIVSVAKKLFLDVPLLLRFLRARDFHIDDATTLLTNHIKWIVEKQPDSITESMIANELKTGKLFWLPNKDKFGRNVLVFFAALHNPSERDINETMNYIIYVLNKGFANMPANSDKQYLFLYDRLGFSRSHFDMDMLKTVGAVLPNQFPETVGNVIILRANWLFWILWKIVKPFMEPKTSHKLAICNSNEVKQKLLEYFDEDSLWEFYGGKFKWEPENNNYLRLVKEEEELSKQPPEAEVDVVDG